ncbi:Cof-type HAD-IIB family hydrolase [Bifidobacterium samirii]|uniref:Haloacid dehalogenase n=1 Tax=Bifidobacterium samirii TaxID=2306974 RepID=A0A430FWX9_9BIFI|nr:Cof-type HAD-IIB family hydrolase [Bifidobacterium samirii]RSX58804.1 haloacid dehalogenase [Bifidobacterium samirii]
MTASDWTAINGPQDIRLIVTDLDGTLLDEHSAVPDGFWTTLERLHGRGVHFVPASGRQYATLRAMFADRVGYELSYVAENGGVVAADGEIVDVSGVDTAITRTVIDLVDAACASGAHDVGLVLCGLTTAYVQRRDEPFLDECRKYYHALRIVDDLHDVIGLVESGEETMIKLAVFDFGDVESTARDVLAPAAADYAMVVSGAHWVDVMNPDTDKRRGVEALQRHFGVTPEQTAVFGDYLNDLGMLAAGEFSFAMGNAHPDLKRAARYIAPTNAEHGVLQVIDRIVA